MEVKTMVGHNKSMEISLCKWDFFFSFIEYLSDMTRIHINYCKTCQSYLQMEGYKNRFYFKYGVTFFLISYMDKTLK